ncbi:response regulator [Candidatus Latescibacterota bacterium]
MVLNILIVDDSEIMRKVIRRIVSLSGFELGEVYEAENGEEALKVLNDNWIDVVLSDINMPVMNGIELLKTMKKTEGISDTPVIVVSTEGRSEKIEEIMNLGAAGFITKPFKPEDIRSVISEALGVEADGDNSEEFEDSDF